MMDNRKVTGLDGVSVEMMKAALDLVAGLLTTWGREFERTRRVPDTGSKRSLPQVQRKRDPERAIQLQTSVRAVACEEGS